MTAPKPTHTSFSSSSSCSGTQVFKDRRLNAWGGFVVGGVWAGFSVDWWKGKHNTHHAAPNEVTAGGMPVDPDVDTLPLIAWSPELLSTVQDPALPCLHPPPALSLLPGPSALPA